MRQPRRPAENQKEKNQSIGTKKKKREGSAAMGTYRGTSGRKEKNIQYPYRCDEKESAKKKNSKRTAALSEFKGGYMGVLIVGKKNIKDEGKGSLMPSILERKWRAEGMTLLRGKG